MAFFTLSIFLIPRSLMRNKFHKMCIRDSIGIWASLKRKKGTSLFLAERSLKWHHIGLSMWGTNVGPSMLIASASAGITTGIVSGNYAWYAFVFICLLAFVFAPRYLGARDVYKRQPH